MIRVYDEEQLIHQVIEEGVLHELPRCQNVVVPPAFNEGKLVAEFVRRLREHPRKPMVACCAPGQLRGVQDYVAHVHGQWSETYRLAKLRSTRNDLAQLRYLLSSLPNEPPAIHVLHGFHHAMEKLGQEALNIIGEYEDSDETPLQAIAVTPYRITTMKEMWRKQSGEQQSGANFTISRYGDKHRFRIIQPWPREKLLQLLIGRGIPHVTAEWFIGLSGGYPDPLNAIIAEWEKRRGPELTVNIMRELQEVARDAVRTFVDYLDLPAPHTRWRVAEIFRGDGRESAGSVLMNHPWKTLLLDDESESLRAESVGLATMQSLVEDGDRQTRGGSSTWDVFQEAEGMYRRSRYNVAARMLQGSLAGHQPPPIALLRAHSQVMAAICGEDVPGEMSDWVAVLRAVAYARETAASLPSVSDRNRRTLENRYRQLERIANEVQTAHRAAEELGVPMLDVAAGLLGDCPLAPKTVAVLLWCMAESGRALSGDASACIAILSLAEQLFRIWALWKLNLNYYRAPDDVQRHWAEAETARRRLHVDNRDWERPVVGGPFPSVLAFAYYALTVYRNSGRDIHSTVAADSDALTDTLLVHARFKNPPAGSAALFSGEGRRTYFEAIDRWLAALLKACPNRSTREEVMAVVAPLPLLDKRGRLTAKTSDSLAMTPLRDETMTFDVFLCHNSDDKQTIRRLAKRLRERQVRVWFDEWELSPGGAWHEVLEGVIGTCRAAAVCIGMNGIGIWQEPEIQAILTRFAKEKHAEDGPRVIPVFLPGAPLDAKLPVFLERFTWVDMRGGIRRQDLDKLQWGINGVKPVR